jgi:hypothetical protein
MLVCVTCAQAHSSRDKRGAATRALRHCSPSNATTGRRSARRSPTVSIVLRIVFSIASHCCCAGGFSLARARPCIVIGAHRLPVNRLYFTGAVHPCGEKLRNWLRSQHQAAAARPATDGFRVRRGAERAGGSGMRGRASPDCGATRLHPGYASPPQTFFAMSRSLNFWTLPVEVFGSSENTMNRGHL